MESPAMPIPNHSDNDMDISITAVPGEHSESAAALVAAAKNTLTSTGLLKSLKKSLLLHLHILSDDPQYDKNSFFVGKERQEMLENWIDELLKFLALKTLMCDTIKPCQLAPGYAITVGWKALISMPTCYSKVCIAMGNSSVFDPDPFDESCNNGTQLNQRLTRYNTTLRAYENCFGCHPPPLYWSFDARPKKESRASFLNRITLICGCGTVDEPTVIPMVPAFYAESV